jgi:hypothetical protein
MKWIDQVQNVHRRAEAFHFESHDQDFVSTPRRVPR